MCLIPLQENMMIFDAFTISSILVVALLVIATLYTTGCCRKKR
jgi:hypothetical protein